MKTNIKLISVVIVSVIFSFLVSSCAKELDVENLNDPDREQVLKNPEDVQTLAFSGFYNWFMANNSSWSPRMAMWVMADQGTCSWANSGMYHLSSEPRVPFNNSVTYTYAYIFEEYYQDTYGNLYIMNNVLDVIDEGMVILDQYGIDNTEMVKAASYFIQGLSLGYLGLVYDKAFIVKRSTGWEDIPTSPYMDVIEAAIVSLDSVISICDRAYFTLPPGYISGTEYNQVDLRELASSFAARFLIYAPRNKAENDQIDWNRVLSYANNGITQDLAPVLDDVAWKSYFRKYTVQPGWARIDSRIIYLMDPNFPYRYPEDGHNPPAAESDDQRLEYDFNHNTANNMKPERGYYHYSDYEYVRYPLYISTTKGPSPVFIVAENDLIRAEALTNLGDIPGAVNIINQSRRVQILDPETNQLVDNLPAVNENISKEEMLEIIFYERDIELIQTGFGIAFFDMRRRDMLQYGTMLHFPITGKDLMTMELPEYTFGGEANADGIGTSNGGWFPEK